MTRTLMGMEGFWTWSEMQMLILALPDGGSSSKAPGASPEQIHPSIVKETLTGRGVFTPAAAQGGDKKGHGT